ncbi:MAG: outer membrane lipoprotein carrier protein LolA [Rikenellaceae bacterium]
MYRLIIISLLMLSINNVSAQDPQDSKDFESRIESVSTTNKSIQCDFEQRKRVKGIKDEVESHGRFYYDNRGVMSLLYDEPKGDKIVINGERFEVVTSGKVVEGEASENPMMMQICNMLQACMSGDVTRLGRGWQSDVVLISGQYIVTLQPTDRRTRRYIESLVLTFNHEDMTLDEMKMNESSGGYTHYRFINKEINKSIDPQKFE